MVEPNILVASVLTSRECSALPHGVSRGVCFVPSWADLRALLIGRILFAKDRTWCLDKAAGVLVGGRI